VSDAIPLMTLVSGVLVVGRLGSTSRDSATRLAHQLAHLHARVLGVVINATPRRGGGYAYGYGHGYGYPAEPVDGMKKAESS
jgi:Mrp family chromosome partitioning ATPase